ncbi:Protein DJ-1 protein [Aphelenchoides fujianensis]|nr:Protein DJ-1 protein [Aphelenchoides fujianensis]
MPSPPPKKKVKPVFVPRFGWTPGPSSNAARYRRARSESKDREQARVDEAASRSRRSNSAAPRGVYEHAAPLPVRKTASIVASDRSEDVKTIAKILNLADVDVTISELQDAEKIRPAREAVLSMDERFKNVADQDFDAVIIPGGPEHKKAAQDKRVGEILKRHEKNGKLIAALGEGALVLTAHDIAWGGLSASDPKKADEVDSGRYFVYNVHVLNDKVVTARGPGAASELALKIVELLAGNEVANKIRSSVLQ